MTLSLIARALYETGRISVPTVLEARRGSLRTEECSARLSEWSRRLLRQADVDVVVEGLERLEKLPRGLSVDEPRSAVGSTPRRSLVVMSNHQSFYDIPVLFRALPFALRMVAKAELFRVPVWGQAMLDAGFVRIDRGRGAAAYRTMQEQGRELQARGLSLWVAPEGTRSPDGRLLPFQGGAFALARCLGLPLLPVTIDGTKEILGKRQVRITRGRRVHVVVHDPIFPGDLGKGRRDTRHLIDRIHQTIAAALPIP